MKRSRRSRLSRSSASASISTDASEATSASRPPPLQGADHQIAEVGAEAVRAAKQFAIVKNAEAEAALDVDDEEVVEAARLSEPVLGEGRRD